jgi:hypothetical protein
MGYLLTVPINCSEEFFSYFKSCRSFRYTNTIGQARKVSKSITIKNRFNFMGNCPQQHLKTINN